EGASSGALSSRRDSSSSKRSTEGLGRTIAPSRGDRPGCREKNGVCAQGGESPRRSRTGLSDGQEPERMSQQPFSGGARAQAPKGYRADASRIQYGIGKYLGSPHDPVTRCGPPGFQRLGIRDEGGLYYHGPPSSRICGVSLPLQRSRRPLRGTARVEVRL